MDSFQTHEWVIEMGATGTPPTLGGGHEVFRGPPFWSPEPPGRYEFRMLKAPAELTPGGSSVTLYHGKPAADPPSPVWTCPVTIKSPPTTAPPPGTVPVQDFSVSCNPAALTAAPGGSAPSTCTVKSQGGFNQPVTLSCTGQPVGAACAFKPNPVTPPPNGSIDSALTVNVLGDAGTGDFKFQVVGTAGRVTRKAALGLAISLQPPPPPGPPIELPGPKGPEALELDRPSAEPGGDVNASGKGCDPNAPVELFLEGTQVGSGVADEAGDFDIPIKLPDSAGVGRHEVIAECGPTIETTVDVVVVARAESPGAPMGVLAVLIFFILEVRRLVRREGAVTPRR